ncbi:MAG: UbiA prenyltransferase family protein [Leptospiraceae bacterium]|jgi:4-hydroxybenzoate polyprenyltransferase|nr:UbiA prenyltransferase family protein [Leptospiraceae bacterium]
MKLIKKLFLYIKLIRIYQWTKSGFVFLPFVFSDQAIDLALNPFSEKSIQIYLNLIQAFFAFSFVASSIYVLNDWKDKDLDRLDPKKRFRPIASGEVSPIEAILIFFTLFVLSFLLSIKFNFLALGLILFYFIMNIFYSLGAKKIILLDVFIIAVGFVLRVLFGSFAMGISASPWLISTTFFIALFLGFYKRYFEITIAPAEEMIGGQYRRESLRSFIDISAALSIMTYSLYTITGTHADANLYWTIPFVVMGIFRYYTLLENPSNKEGNPSDVLLADPFLPIVVVLWLISCYGLILYHHFN